MPGVIFGTQIDLHLILSEKFPLTKCWQNVDKCVIVTNNVYYRYICDHISSPGCPPKCVPQNPLTALTNRQRILRKWFFTKKSIVTHFCAYWTILWALWSQLMNLSAFFKTFFRFSILDIYFCPFFKTKLTFGNQIVTTFFHPKPTNNYVTICRHDL